MECFIYITDNNSLLKQFNIIMFLAVCVNLQKYQKANNKKRESEHNKKRFVIICLS